MSTSRRPRLGAVVMAAAIALTAAAIASELRKEPRQRTWNGRVLGVPYDFRRPTRERVAERLWNPRSHQLFSPHVFGVGWTVNFARLKELIGDARNRR